MKKNRNKILWFTVFAAFLVISVSLIPAVSAKSVTLVNNSDKKIGDYVKELVENDQIRTRVSIVLEKLDNQKLKIDCLRDISYVVEEGLMKSTFQELANEIYSVHSEEFDRIYNGNSDGNDFHEDLPDCIESDDVLIQDIFEFTFIKPKSKNLFANSIISNLLERLQRIPFFEKLFNLNPQESEVNNDMMLTQNSNSISLYHKGSAKPIIQGQLHMINSFLLFLEVALRDLSSEDFDLDEYCSELNLSSDIRTDEQLKQDIEKIRVDINLRARTYSLLGLSEEKANKEINSIINDIESHEFYQQIAEKFGENGVEPLFTPFGIPLAVIICSWLFFPRSYDA